MARTITVLGFSGRIGQEVARAFVAAGWQVTCMGRSEKVSIPGTRFVRGDATNADDVRAACAGSDFVANTLNLAYDKWDKGRYEALTQAVVDGLTGSRKTMLFAGNIYNYAAGAHVLTPQTPNGPEKDKGEIRVRIEAMMAAAARRGDFRFVVVRSPDFYGPGVTGTTFDLAMLARIKSNVLQYPGPLDLGHSWAYLPDLGRAWVKIAEHADTFGPVEQFLFGGHFVTGHQMVEAIEAALPQRIKVAPLPWWMLSLVGLFVPVVREVVKMNYLWQHPHKLEDKRLEALLGPEFGTPFKQAVGKTVRSYLPPVDGVARAQAASV